MPKIVGKGVTVVEHDGMTIEELAGNVATKDDTLSIAHVKVSKATAEPWLTLAYDEWICCRRGYVELHYNDDETVDNDEKSIVLTLSTGETCFIAAGERFRPVFPVAAEYTAVCLPAFKPERCHREEEEKDVNGVVSNGVSAKLRDLHSHNNNNNNNNNNNIDNCIVVTQTTAVNDVDESSSKSTETLYHMCRKSRWDEAVRLGNAYFPPTFEQDGGFTHATAVPQRLLETANHFYQDTTGAWICLELCPVQLQQKLGIVTRFENPKAVGDTATNKHQWDEWSCPHIYGGIPTVLSAGVLKRSYSMKRDEHGHFLSIEGLTL